MNKFIVVFVTLLYSALASAENYQISPAGDGKAYLLNVMSGEVLYLNEGESLAVKHSDEIRNFLVEAVDSKKSAPEAMDLANEILEKFYKTQKIGEYWVTTKN